MPGLVLVRVLGLTPTRPNRAGPVRMDPLPRNLQENHKNLQGLVAGVNLPA